jgi:hypothetical protein
MCDIVTLGGKGNVLGSRNHIDNFDVQCACPATADPEAQLLRGRHICESRRYDMGRVLEGVSPSHRGGGCQGPTPEDFFNNCSKMEASGLYLDCVF